MRFCQRRLMGIEVGVIVGILLIATAHGEINPQALGQLKSASLGENVDQSQLTAAWREVVEADLENLSQLLAAFDGASPLGNNWLSAAVDAVVARAALQDQSPDRQQLMDFALDTAHSVLGRETALELLRSQEPSAAEEVIVRLVDDPSARLRRPAVQKLIDAAEAESDEQEQLSAYRRAFEAARDEDHVVTCSAALRKLGQPVDHIEKFGFLMRWQIIGPFDYQDGKGFDAVYVPEQLTLDDYDADYGTFSEKPVDGKDGPVSWTPFVNTARNGVVDLNKAIDELRDAVAYGATIYESDRQRDVEIRLRQQNPCKLWLNGELVFQQPIGHTGNFFDQYTVPVTLREGPNLILIKSCQAPGPVDHPFLKNWQFGVRVCDATGAAVLAKNRLPTPELDPLPSESPSESETDQSEEDSADVVVSDEDASQHDGEVKAD